MVIGKMFFRALAKLVMMAAGDSKTACGNLQLCTGLESGIEGSTHTMGQRRLERSRVRRSKEEAEASDVEDYTESVAAVLDNLTIETEGIEEESAEGLEAALGMEVEEVGKINGEG